MTQWTDERRARHRQRCKELSPYAGLDKAARAALYRSYRDAAAWAAASDQAKWENERRDAENNAALWAEAIANLRQKMFHRPAKRRTAVVRDHDGTWLLPVNPKPRAHATDGAACWCQPQRDTQEPSVIVHNEPAHGPLLTLQ